MSRIDRDIVDGIGEIQALIKHLPLAFSAGFGGFFFLIDKMAALSGALGRVGAFSAVSAFLFMGIGLIASVISFGACTIVKFIHYSKDDKDQDLLNVFIISMVGGLIVALVCVLLVVLFSIGAVISIVY